MSYNIPQTLAQIAHNAAVSEVMTTPKPGLVDALGNGCHNDMDAALFLKSAEAIAPCWALQAETGLNGTLPKAALALLKRTGSEAERAMFEATGGINTHKGLIYLMSLLLYGAGFCAYNGRTMNAKNIAESAASAVQGVVERELGAVLKTKPERKLTNGERLFIAYGITGVRGEAEQAFPSVISAGLPAYRHALAAGASKNNAGLSALLAIMLVCCDSNVIHRAGYDYAKNIYPSLVRKAQAGYSPYTCDYSALIQLENEFIPLRVSPGGAADLLSCTYFLHETESAFTVNYGHKHSGNGTS